jgi:hypothetical protein
MVRDARKSALLTMRSAPALSTRRPGDGRDPYAVSSRFGSVAETFSNNARGYGFRPEPVIGPAKPDPLAGTTRARTDLLFRLSAHRNGYIISCMPTPYIRSQLSSGLVRLRVTPDEPAEGPPAIIEQRPRGSRRPHTDMAVASVRHLIEQTDLTYSEISKKTGVGRASICRWARDGKWLRPAHAPRATDMVPTLRAGRRLRMRRLTSRLEALAERYLRELEEAPTVDPDKLMQALQLVKMARLEAMGNRRRRPRLFHVGEARTGLWASERDAAIRTALKEMRRGGVDIDRAPKEAVDLVIEAYLPVDDHPALRPRGRKRR